jgi:hypothetical protein
LCTCLAADPAAAAATAAGCIAAGPHDKPRTWCSGRPSAPACCNTIAQGVAAQMPAAAFDACGVSHNPHANGYTKAVMHPARRHATPGTTPVAAAAHCQTSAPCRPLFAMAVAIAAPSLAVYDTRGQAYTVMGAHWAPDTWTHRHGRASITWAP